MSKEFQLSRLVATAHFVRRRDVARRMAVKFGCPVYIYRGLAGLTIDTAEPTMGERWTVEPSGQVSHIAAPVA